MHDVMPYLMPDSEYFEHLAVRQLAPDYQACLEGILAPGWTVSRFDLWLKVSTPTAILRNQGFKIHVSATLTNAIEVIRCAAPICTKFGVIFKVVGDPKLLHHLNAKHYDRGSSGKFITIYPPDEETFVSLITALHEATCHLHGPYILSDRRYPGSSVLFYRYGSFVPNEDVLPDGRRDRYILDPDGGRFADLRLADGELPYWVRDPFPSEQEDPEPLAKIGNRYHIREALSFSNSGGVYKALDTENGEFVVIKEARPLTATQLLTSGKLLDAVASLENERRVLARLQHLSCVPRLIDSFGQWEHTFLVEEYLEGVPFSSFRASEAHALLPFEPDIERVRIFCNVFFCWRATS